MTVKELMNVTDKKTMIEVRREHDDRMVFATGKTTYCTSDLYEKVKDKTVMQITALEENLLFVYIDFGMYGENS